MSEAVLSLAPCSPPPPLVRMLMPQATELRETHLREYLGRISVSKTRSTDLFSSHGGRRWAFCYSHRWSNGPDLLLPHFPNSSSRACGCGGDLGLPAPLGCSVGEGRQRREPGCDRGRRPSSGEVCFAAGGLDAAASWRQKEETERQARN